MTVSCSKEALNNTEIARAQPSWSPPVADRYYPVIREAAKRFSVSSHLIHALMITESGCNLFAESASGAQGLCQIMPDTQKEIAQKLSINNFDPFDPVHNIYAGTFYLSEQIIRFGNLSQAVRAYHDGPGRVMSGDYSEAGSNHNRYVLGMYGESTYIKSNIYIGWLTAIRNSSGLELRKAFQQQALSYETYISSVFETHNEQQIVEPGESNNNSDSCTTIQGNQHLPEMIHAGDSFQANGQSISVKEGDTAYSIWNKLGKPQSLQYCE